METKELKVIVAEEVKVSLENLKVKGKEISKEVFEEIAMESSDMMARIAVRSENKIDDFYLVVKPMLDKELDKIDGKEG